MSYQPPPSSGGMQPPSQRPARRGFFDQFRGMQWWEILLAVMPLGLTVIGGLVGVLIGVIALLINVYLARSKLTGASRVVAMIGVVIAAYLLWLILGLLILAATHPA